jgi:hypothetical protein
LLAETNWLDPSFKILFAELLSKFGECALPQSIHCPKPINSLIKKNPAQNLQTTLSTVVDNSKSRA